MNKSQSIISVDSMDVIAALDWYQAMGVDEAQGPDSLNWFETEPNLSLRVLNKNSTPSASTKKTEINTQTRPKPIASRPVQATITATPEQAQQVASQANTIDALYQALCQFDAGHIKRSAKNTVFADGISHAPIMLIGESPGFDEDRQGKPFIGDAGQMLDKMFASIGLSRTKNLYITNIIPWRLIGTPTPPPELVSLCLPFVKKHIELAKPKIIVALGKLSTQALLGLEGSINTNHGRMIELPINDQTFAAMSSYHPAYLMKATQHKKSAWSDLLKLEATIKEMGIQI